MDLNVRAKADKVGRSIYNVSTSWIAIGFFFVLCSGWIILNSFQYAPAFHFDPYPFNNLRLILSFIGAVQAPLLLTYSRKSTESRRDMLEQDLAIARKTHKKVKWMKKHMEKDNVRTSDPSDRNEENDANRDS